MTQLLILREHIQKMYQRYSSFFQVVMRFMVGFGLFFAINRVLGYRPILSHGYVNVIMGVISVIFPLEAMIFLVALFIVLQVMYVSKMLAFCIGVIFLILYLLYIQFIPKHGYVLIAVPLAYSVGLSAGAPVLLGLLFWSGRSAARCDRSVALLFVSQFDYGCIFCNDRFLRSVSGADRSVGGGRRVVCRNSSLRGGHVGSVYDSQPAR